MIEGMFNFKEALPIKGETKNPFNNFWGFRTTIDVPKESMVQFKIGARSFYRLYLNGEMVSHGPARTAAGYLRIDELAFSLEGTVEVAIEVCEYDKPDKYSNDIDLGEGVLVAEILLNGQVISATGKALSSTWRVLTLDFRRPDVEYISHSREIIESYCLDEESLTWKTKNDYGMNPELAKQSYVYLTRHSPLPKYSTYKSNKLIKINSIVSELDEEPQELTEIIHKQWYKQIDKTITRRIFNDRKTRYLGEWNQSFDGIEVRPEKNVALLFQFEKSYVGFIELIIEVNEELELDVLYSDYLNAQGEIDANSNVLNYTLKPGKYHIISFEPYLAKFIELRSRSASSFTVRKLAIKEYAFFDDQTCHFYSSDEQLNKIFDISKETLRMNMLDIFMDCPGRERGGWLCDSFWMGRAAQYLFGNSSVEQDFLSNYFLLDEEKYDYGFFPEVFPGTPKKDNPTDAGITNYSLWLLIEFYEYIQRTNDTKMCTFAKHKIETVFEGFSKFIGDSGLLENLPHVFLDWSQSNNKENTSPISVPTNALYSMALIQMGKLYDEKTWIEAGLSIKKMLNKINTLYTGLFDKGTFPDSLTTNNGSLISKSSVSETATYIDVWTGTFTKDENPHMVDNVIKRMGLIPEKKENIYVGKADLCFGLTLRMDILSMLTEKDILIKEIKHLYLPQVLNGPGTFFESVRGPGQTNGSLCHGFNGHVGYLIIKDFLGINAIDYEEKTIEVNPYVTSLEWASGKTKIYDTDIYLYWEVNHLEKTFHMTMDVTEKNWRVFLNLPDQLSHYTLIVNDKTLDNENQTMLEIPLSK